MDWLEENPSPSEWIELEFSRLRNNPTYEPKSPVDQDYNCIAFAADDTERWWWPPGPFGGGSYWPPEAPTELTVESFIAVFRTLGYELCSDGTPEEGYEKVAIYEKRGEPTHAARQEPDGRWLSKLGQGYDIVHQALEDIGGENGYGDVAVFLRRIRPAPPGTSE